MVQGSILAFDTAAKLFPLNYSRRLGGVHARIILPDHTTWQETASEIRMAFRTDPNNIDLWYNLVRMDLKLNDEQRYTSDLGHLEKLTPQVTYQLQRTEGPP